MSKWFYTIISLILALICSADGCSEKPEAHAIKEMQHTSDLIDTVIQAFTVDTLSQDDLAAYEYSAIQKLTDLSDYLNTVSDTTLDFMLRNQAYEMILDLFIERDSDFRYLSLICPDWVPKTNDSFDSESLFISTPCLFSPSDIAVTERFQRVSDNTYKGTVSFSLGNKYEDRTRNEGEPGGPYTIEIYLIRKMKSFGSQRLNVWNTFLGYAGIPE